MDTTKRTYPAAPRRPIRPASLAPALGAAVLIVTLIAVAPPRRALAADPVPTGQEVVRRLLLTIARVGVVSADIEFRLRVLKALSDPPDCVFRGMATLTNGQPLVQIADRSAGLLCWAANRYVIGRPFRGKERLEAFLSRFEFDVLAEKLVGNDRYYLVRGTAKDPKNEPRAMIGWIDFDEGLLTENTVEYSWGSIDSTQTYARAEHAWVLTYQYFYTPRFHASMEIVYRNFRFSPGEDRGGERRTPAPARGGPGLAGREPSDDSPQEAQQ